MSAADKGLDHYDYCYVIEFTPNKTVDYVENMD